MPYIKSSVELKNKYNEISVLCKETKEPVYITLNGQKDIVILSLEQFNQMQAELELLKMLSESEDDVRNGRISKVGNSFNEIKEKIYNEIKKPSYGWFF